MVKKSDLTLMGQMKREAERDFHKFIKYVAELEEENKLLKARNEELNENCYGLAKENEELKKENRILQEGINTIVSVTTRTTITSDIKEFWAGGKLMRSKECFTFDNK